MRHLYVRIFPSLGFLFSLEVIIRCVCQYYSLLPESFLCRERFSFFLSSQMFVFIMFLFVTLNSIFIILSHFPNYRRFTISFSSGVSFSTFVSSSLSFFLLMPRLYIRPCILSKYVAWVDINLLLFSRHFLS